MTRPIVEGYQKVDIRAMRRNGQLPDHASMLSFSFSGVHDQTVQLLHRRRGQLAGVRMYFRCPRCPRACELLYFGRAGLACQKCLRLAYCMEGLSKLNRATEQIFKLRRRLGQEPASTFDDPPEKPRWMRWATYDRKIERLEILDTRADQALRRSAAGLLVRCGLDL